MNTLAKTKAIPSSYQSLTKMTHSTLGTCRLLVWWVSTLFLFISQFISLIITSLWELGCNLISNSLLKSRLVFYVTIFFEEPPSNDLDLLASLLFLIDLSPSTLPPCTIRWEMFMLSCSMVEWHSSCMSSAPPSQSDSFNHSDQKPKKEPIWTI